MAKRGRRVLRAWKAGRDDDSLLIRSAESLGRVIGSLQRRVQASSNRVSSLATKALNARPEMPRFDRVFDDAPSASRKRASTSTRASGARKSTGTTRNRKGGAAGPAAARSAAGSRKRSGSRKSSKKR